MKIDHFSTTLGVENDIESHCYVKYIIVPAIFANVIMPRRHTQKGVIDDLHSTTVYFRVFTNFSISDGKVGWNLLRELVKRVEGLVDKLEISTRFVNCTVNSASNRSDRFLCPPFPYFYCFKYFDNFFISLNHRTFEVVTRIYRYPGAKSLKNHNLKTLVRIYL